MCSVGKTNHIFVHDSAQKADVATSLILITQDFGHSFESVFLSSNGNWSTICYQSMYAGVAAIVLIFHALVRCEGSLD